MRKVSIDVIKRAVARISVEANTVLRTDVLRALEAAYRKETKSQAKNILRILLENAAVARRDSLSICQDTGLPVIFVELGDKVKITEGSLKEAINRGIELGYRKGFLRNSVIRDPILRTGLPGYQPAIIHFDLVKGDKLKISILPKGFGCENKTQIKMFNPTASIEEIKKFIVQVVKLAGPDACPPFIVGVGIGGSADYAAFLAKKALLRKIDAKRSTLSAKLESELLKEINKLNIGPMGLGGKTTALAVNILTYPTHIAGLPVAVNISCHALRSATALI